MLKLGFNRKVLQKLDQFDEAAILDFIKSARGKSPEPLAP